MTSRNVLAALAATALLTGLAACGGSSSDNSSSHSGGALNGAGATFPQPIYNEWAARFQKQTGTVVNYQGVGSGGGVAQFTAGTVDFGASDAAMSDEEIAAAKKGQPLHIPTVLGAVAIAYNVGGVEKGLKLDGATIAEVFLGRIKNWNDPAISKLNAGITLPATPVTLCERSDGSGTTKNFTAFLAASSPAWKNGPGVGKTVKWPAGTGAKGNDGVASCIKQSDGAIGYVEQAYAAQNGLATAAVKNRAGSFVEPSLDATAAAGAGASPPADLRFSTIDAPGATSYPISAITFLLVYRDPCRAGMTAERAGLLKGWLDYALGEGQKVAPDLQFAPLPAAVLAKAKAAVASMTCDGKAISGK